MSHYRLSFDSSPYHSFADISLSSPVEPTAKRGRRLFYDPKSNAGMERVFSEYDWSTNTFLPTLLDEAHAPVDQYSPQECFFEVQPNSRRDCEGAQSPFQRRQTTPSSNQRAGNDTLLSAYLLSSSSNICETEQWPSSSDPYYAISRMDSIKSPLQRSMASHMKADRDLLHPQNVSSCASNGLPSGPHEKNEPSSFEDQQYPESVISRASSTSQSDTIVNARRNRSSTWSSDATTVSGGSSFIPLGDKGFLLGSSVSNISEIIPSPATTPPFIHSPDFIYGRDVSSHRLNDAQVQAFYSRSGIRSQTSKERATEVETSRKSSDRENWSMPDTSPSQPINQNPDLSIVWEGDIESTSTIVDRSDTVDQDPNLSTASHICGLDQKTQITVAREGRLKKLTASAHHRYVAFDLRLRLALFHAEKKVAQTLKEKWRKRAVTC